MIPTGLKEIDGRVVLFVKWFVSRMTVPPRELQGLTPLHAGGMPP